jgi:hypothetical protein
MEKGKIHLIRVFSILFIFMMVSTSCTLKEVKPPLVIQEPPVVEPSPKPAKIGLVLGAGSSKGFAHIGVLKILESNKIPIHMIVGTSVGSIVGSLYAYGYDAFQLQKLSFSIETGDIIDLTIPDNGFIKGEKLEEFINKTLKYTPIEKLKVPFYAVATDILNGQEIGCMLTEVLSVRWQWMPQKDLVLTLSSQSIFPQKWNTLSLETLWKRSSNPLISCIQNLHPYSFPRLML